MNKEQISRVKLAIEHMKNPLSIVFYDNRNTGYSTDIQKLTNLNLIKTSYVYCKGCFDNSNTLYIVAGYDKSEIPNLENVVYI